MEQFSNRVEQELVRFRTREEKLAALFPSDTGGQDGIRAEKNKFYGQLLLKYRDTRNADELFLLQRVKSEKAIMEKELHPNRLWRFLARIFSSVPKERSGVQRYRRELLDNRSLLVDAVSASGFHVAADRMQQHLAAQKDSFSLPVSHYVTEKERMEHQLVFSRDGSGDYVFEGFKASLHNEAEAGSVREHFFKADGTVFTSSEAYQLLAGRAVQKDGIWMQFDLNDRSAAGCFRMKEFHQNYGFDLKKAVECLPLKDSSAEGIEDLVKVLKQGGSPMASFEVKGKEYRFSIEASPQFKRVVLYDEHSKKVSLTALRGTSQQKRPAKAATVQSMKGKNKKAVKIR